MKAVIAILSAALLAGCGPKAPDESSAEAFKRACDGNFSAEYQISTFSESLTLRCDLIKKRPTATNT